MSSAGGTVHDDVIYEYELHCNKEDALKYRDLCRPEFLADKTLQAREALYHLHRLNVAIASGEMDFDDAVGCIDVPHQLFTATVRKPLQKPMRRRSSLPTPTRPYRARSLVRTAAACSAAGSVPGCTAPALRRAGSFEPLAPSPHADFSVRY